MANIEIKSSELSEIVSLASEASEKLTASLETAQKLLSSSQAYDQTWTGESKDSYVMYLGIVSKYHKDLAKAVKNYHKAVKALNKDINSFDSAEMAEIRGI